MKTCALYGFMIALADALLILVLFFLGWQSDPAKLTIGRWVGNIGMLAIGFTLTALGVKARRSEISETVPFGYGSALWAGTLVSFVACLLGSIFSYCYMAFINPGLADIIVQTQQDALQAKGISGDQAEKVEKVTRFLISPGPYAITALIAGFIFPHSSSRLLSPRS